MQDGKLHNQENVAYTLCQKIMLMYLQILTYVHLFGIAHKPFTQFSHLAKSEKLYSN